MNCWFYIIQRDCTVINYIILLYNFISLIWLIGLAEVVSTCSRQKKLITCSKKYLINDYAIVSFLHDSTGSQINIDIVHSTAFSADHIYGKEADFNNIRA